MPKIAKTGPPCPRCRKRPVGLSLYCCVCRATLIARIGGRRRAAEVSPPPWVDPHRERRIEDLAALADAGLPLGERRRR